VETIDNIRQRMPSTRKNGFFNTGARGPMPQPVVDAWKQSVDDEFTLGRQGPWYGEARSESRKKMRQGFARVLGAAPESIAVTTSTTEAMNTVLSGINWQKGDEVVTTDCEFPSLNTALALLAKRFGVTVRVAVMPTRAENLDAEAVERTVVERFAAEINPNTRLLAFSHVLYISGLKLPLDAICQLAGDNNVAVLCDAAQSVGASPVDVTASKVDYYAFPGQKWLCGPEGIGGLYVAPHRLEDLNLMATRTAAEMDFSGHFEPRAGALRFEAAAFDLPRLRAMAAALDWFFELGPDFIFERNHALARRFVTGLQAIPATTVISPEGYASLVGFDLAGWKDTEAVAALRDRGFLIRRVPGNLLRISFGYFNLEQEVDALLNAVEDLATRKNDTNS
jgi:L-cysteine/cystine lyase